MMLRCFKRIFERDVEIDRLRLELQNANARCLTYKYFPSKMKSDRLAERLRDDDDKIKKLSRIGNI